MIHIWDRIRTDETCADLGARLGADISRIARSQSNIMVDAVQPLTDSQLRRIDLSFPGYIRRGVDPSLIVDRKTAQDINAAIHPFCSTEEQLGILRDQLVKILNALGLEATTDFARLNDVAIAEIEKARVEKEALDA